MMTFWMSGGADMLSQTMGLLGFDRNTVNGMLTRLQTTQLAFRRGHVPDLPDVSSVERGVLEEMSRAFGKWRNEAKEAAEVYDPAADADAYELIIRESINIFPNWYSSLGAVAKKNGEDHPKVTRMKSGLEHAEKALLKISGHLKSRIRLLRTKEKEECEEGKIRLLTMHGSKGLEWDDVYIIGADERDDDSTITAGPAERRVMFVGMTRARSKLNVTFSGKMPIFMKEAGFKNEDVQIEPPIVMTALAAEEEEGDGLIE
jgi:superfamily I DNA/RNA helicase